MANGTWFSRGVLINCFCCLTFFWAHALSTDRQFFIGLIKVGLKQFKPLCFVDLTFVTSFWPVVPSSSLIIQLFRLSQEAQNLVLSCMWWSGMRLEYLRMFFCNIVYSFFLKLSECSGCLSHLTLLGLFPFIKLDKPRRVLRFLITHPESVDSPVQCQGRLLTPLMYACLNDSYKAAEVLLRRGARYGTRVGRVCGALL